MTRFVPIILVLALAGCEASLVATPPVEAPRDAGGAEQTRPQARPGGLSVAPPPPPTARTQEEFDTTTQAERAAAAAPPEPAGETRLGETVASLGDVTRSGFWLETPLVSAATQGRVLFPQTGKSAQVELIPIDGPATAGSRISLPAMRLIEAPLTDLPTLVVFAEG